MGTPKDRVHARFQVDLKVTMKWRRNVETLPVFDVSEGGVYVATESPPALRELVRLEFELPPNKTVLSAHGMAVNLVDAASTDGRPPGIGVQFYALDRDAQRAWSAFIDGVRKGQLAVPRRAPAEPLEAPRKPSQLQTAPEPVAVLPLAPPRKPSQLQSPADLVEAPRKPSQLQSPAEPVAVLPLAPPRKPSQLQTPPPFFAPGDDVTSFGEMPDPFGRGAVARPAVAASLELDIASEEDLYEFYMRDIAEGRMFILSDVSLARGAEVSIVVRHPTEDRVFEIDAFVVACQQSPDGPGLDVEFYNLSERRLEALRDFIDGGEEVQPEVRQRPAARRDAPAPKPAPKPATSERAHVAQSVWDDPFARDAQAQIAQLFEPWVGAAEQRPWSKPPPDDDIDLMFDALANGDLSGVRPSGVPSPANEDVPDFLLAAPTFDDNPFEPAPAASRDDDAVSIDLDDDDLVEVRDEPRSARAPHPMSNAR